MTTRSTHSCRPVLPALFALLLVLGCGEGATPPGGDSGGHSLGPSSVVDVAWLSQRLGDSGVQIVDARTQATEFEAGHIPGALRLDPFELAADVGGILAQISPPAAAGPILRERGVRAGTTAVVYGKAPEYDPARVAWALLYYGHDDVRYLDGGWEAWEASGQPIETGPSDEPASSYQPDGPVAAIRVTGDWILDRLGDSSLQIVDVRSPEEYAAGHIPGSSHIRWSTNLEDGFLKSREEIDALHAGLDKSTTTVVYCTAGWRASFSWITMQWLGFEDVRIYDGSWIEWGAGGRFPIEAG